MSYDGSDDENIEMVWGIMKIIIINIMLLVTQRVIMKQKKILQKIEEEIK